MRHLTLTIVAAFLSPTAVASGREIVGQIVLIGDGGAGVAREVEATLKARPSEARELAFVSTCTQLRDIVAAANVARRETPRNTSALEAEVSRQWRRWQSTHGVAKMGRSEAMPETAAVPARAARVLGDLAAVAQPKIAERLAAELASKPAPTLVAWLGDNVYEYGVPPRPQDGAQSKAAQAFVASCMVLEQQVQASLRAEQVVFVPGNHDWNSRIFRDSKGADRVCAQAELIEELSKPSAEGDLQSNAKRPPVALYPRNVGCPGPDMIDFPTSNGRAIRVILIDTEAALQKRTKPCAPQGADCTKEVAGRIRDLVQDAKGPDDVVILGHHPMITYGKHAGAGLSFPMRWLRWLGGSLGVSHQDVWGRGNRRLRKELRQAMATATGRRPIAYVGGHDHSLQVIRASSAEPWYVVSGSASKTSPVRDDKQLVYKRRDYGFAVLRFYSDGGVDLKIEALGEQTSPVLELRAAASMPARSTADVRAD